MTGVPLALRRCRGVLVLVSFLCFLALGVAPQAGAAGSGAFSPAGSKGGARFGAVAAPLPAGRVLLAGGRHDLLPRTPDMESAEVFNSATNTFSSAGIGSMSVPRSGAVAAPLPDGRVLVAGGSYTEWIGFSGEVHYLSSAEVFNPATGTFSSAGIGAMSVPRYGAAAAPLPDGRVLVAGGFYYDGSGHSLSSAEVFNPATGSFSSAGIAPMSVPRIDAVAAPLPDGRVLVAGGGPDPASAEVFNLSTGTFSSTGIGSMSVPRFGAAGAPLSDGRVLVAGGRSSRAAPSSAEVFDPATNGFSSTGIGSMSVGRIGAVAAPLPGGRVLVAGGEATGSAEIFALVSCRGRQATLVGSGGADEITGTPGADVIIGVDGNDKLSGLGGNDLICGGQGDDTVNGGVGNDQLRGQQGNDRLWGRKGKDRLSGQAGNDTLKGGPGKDTLKGGAGKDVEAEEKPARRRH